MKRQEVDSSVPASIGYDEKSKTLEVEFNRRAIYQYFDVEKDVFDDLMNDCSVGSYFNGNIKNDYDYHCIKNDNLQNE